MAWPSFNKKHAFSLSAAGILDGGSVQIRCVMRLGSIHVRVARGVVLQVKELRVQGRVVGGGPCTAPTEGARLGFTFPGSLDTESRPEVKTVGRG